MRNLLLVCLFMGAVSCNPTEIECCAIEGESLTGEWKVFERGYSLGGGYIIEEFSKEPLATVIFKNNGDFESDYVHLMDFRKYRIFQTESADQLILALYKNQLKNYTLEEANASYGMNFESDQLKLWFRYCIEGCHIGIKRQ